MIERYFDTIITELRYLDGVCGGNRPFVIGLSGGIDSALVLCLLEQAFGNRRIYAFNLPTPFNSKATRMAARALSERLDIVFQEIPIDPIVDAVCQTLETAGFTPSDFHKENIQAKVRGTDLLSNLAAVLDGLMTNNGNKVEATLGYATLYGDTNGAVCPIGDLTKLEVWDLARYFNTTIYGREVIPGSLIPDSPTAEALIRPSAELAAGQFDPMKWGYHDALTTYFVDASGEIAPLLAAWRDGSISTYLSKYNGLTPEENAEILAQHHLDDRKIFLDDLHRFLTLMHRAAFKRFQLPPVIRVKARAPLSDVLDIFPLTREQLDAMC